VVADRERVVLALRDEPDLLQGVVGCSDVEEAEHEALVRAPVRARVVHLAGRDEAEREQERLHVAAELLGDGAPGDVAVARRPVRLEEAADERGVDGAVVRVEDRIRDVGVPALAGVVGGGRDGL
jgi:hypothetical protein